MVFHLDVTFEVSINHLADNGRPVWWRLEETCQSLPIDMSAQAMLKDTRGEHSPGNRIIWTRLPSATSLSSSSFTCVVLPLRSSPSSTMNAPLVGGALGEAMMAARWCRDEKRGAGETIDLLGGTWDAVI